MSKLFNTLNALMDVIFECIEDKISTAKFDITRRGFITSVNKGVYTVDIGNSSSIIKSEAIYSVGDTVLVLFPQNNPNDKYIIGKVVK